jgi:methylated-DNA-protein-cysteine methyltransferase related protein
MHELREPKHSARVWRRRAKWSVCITPLVYSGAMFAAIQAAVRKIPRGKVSTYGEIAKAAGYPGAARQVVWALRASKGLPWHRVVGAGGHIRLPGAAGLEQRIRLEAEGVKFSGQRVQMNDYEFKWKKEVKRRKKPPQRKRSRRRSR